MSNDYGRRTYQHRVSKDGHIQIDERLNIVLPQKGQSIILKERKSTPGPRAKTVKEFAKKGAKKGDYTYLKEQDDDMTQDGELRCEVIGVYSRFISVQYTDNYQNTRRTSVPIFDLLTKRKQITLIENNV